MHFFAKIRARLHAANPCCCYCGVITINRKRSGRAGTRQFPNDATVEHVHSKLTGPREGRNHVNNLKLACYKCNNERAQREDADLPKDKRDSLSIRGKARDSWYAAWDREMDRFDRF